MGGCVDSSVGGLVGDVVGGSSAGGSVGGSVACVRRRQLGGFRWELPKLGRRSVSLVTSEAWYGCLVAR
jgi:hypothetical protein